MPGFDIESLLQFQPARYHCEKCRALLKKPLPSQSNGRLVCPVCRLEYIPADFNHEQWGDYLEQEYCSIKFDDIIEHGKQLARAAYQIRNCNLEVVPPLRILFEALSNAQQFVHFTTTGISHMIIGALKMVAQRVSVCGIVSNVEAATLAELVNFGMEAPNLTIRAYGSEASWRDMPHQKLVVIDGLLAFKGSANLTQNAWRKAAQGRDEVEVVTNVEEVINLHNRYFSPIWAELVDQHHDEPDLVRYMKRWSQPQLPPPLPTS
jgi:hypothetical protein